MKPKHNIRFIKNLGQFFIAPLLGLILAILAILGGSIPGYFAFIFGAFIMFAMTFVVLFIYDKLVVQRFIRENEEYEKEYREKIRRMMEEENDPNAYSEYDDTGFVDDKYEEERTGKGEFEKNAEKKQAEKEAEKQRQLEALEAAAQSGERELKVLPDEDDEDPEESED